ncbi:MAG: hypothetical protein ACE5RM_02325, partial [Candidatus Nitrosomaritimum aestuariumsis]
MTSNFTTKLTIVALIPLMMIFVSPNIISDSFAIDMVTCKDGDVLVKKTQTGNHACLHESSAKKIEARGWGTIVSANDNVIVMEGEEIASPGSLLALSRANVPATIPMHQGFYNGESVYFIITDSSDPTHAEVITENQGWKVELAPLLANAPDEALSTTYMFTNGISGDGVHNFQGEVFTSTPAQQETYSALTAHVHVTWAEDVTPRILDSEEMILEAEDAGEVTLSPVPVVLNMPQIVWPEGQMMVKEDKTLADDTPYGGGQVLDIDTEEMTVTFIAHRGWGPDGRTIYYIVTDATPSGPAGMMGVVDAPTSASLIANSAAVDLFQFRNGIAGSGPLGFQPGIAAGAPDDANYSPMWRIFMIGWEDTNSAAVLETKAYIDAYQEAGLISVGLARPMDS